MKNLSIILVFFVFPYLLKSQENSLYQLSGTYPARTINPAFNAPFKGYLSVPILPQFSFNAGISSFNYNDVIKKGTGEMKDSLVLSLNNLSSKLKDRNSLAMDFRYELFGFGQHFGKNFFSFDVALRTNMHIGFPGDILAFRTGNFSPGSSAEGGKTRNIDLSGLQVNSSTFTEYGFSMTTSINESIRIGARVKFLSGIFNLYSKKSDFYLNTNAEDYSITAKSGFDLYMSGPIEVEYDEEGMVDFNKIGIAEDIDLNTIFAPKNQGAAIDLGITWKVKDNLNLSASINDLGFIKWKTNTHQLQAESSFVFNGIDISPQEDGTFDMSESIDELSDSISNAFSLNNAEDIAYTKYLGPKVFLAGEYLINEKYSAGALLKTSVYNKSIHPEFTLSCIGRPADFFSFAVTYSVINNSYTNLGAAFSLHFGAFQMYFANDNLTGLFIPHKTRVFNQRFGMLFLLGKK